MNDFIVVWALGTQIYVILFSLVFHTFGIFTIKKCIFFNKRKLSMPKNIKQSINNDYQFLHFHIFQ